MAKYKVLKSIAHNFSHSFVSLTNYVEDGYVIDDLRRIVRKLGRERLSIVWIPEEKQSALLTSRICTSIAVFRSNLPVLVESSGGKMEMIKEFRTDIYLNKSHQIIVEGILTDDRGHTYTAPVYDF